jgi:anti-anti-sigma factor
MAQLERGGGAQATAEAVVDGSGATVIKLAGEIDISNAGSLEVSLGRLIRSGNRTLVIDLSALDFMDSAGIAMVLRAVAGVESVSIRNPSSVVRRILECTGLTSVLPIES